MKFDITTLKTKLLHTKKKDAINKIKEQKWKWINILNHVTKRYSIPTVNRSESLYKNYS